MVEDDSWPWTLAIIISRPSIYLWRIALSFTLPYGLAPLERLHCCIGLPITQNIAWSHGITQNILRSAGHCGKPKRGVPAVPSKTRTWAQEPWRPLVKHTTGFRRGRIVIETT